MYIVFYYMLLGLNKKSLWDFPYLERQFSCFYVIKKSKNHPSLSVLVLTNRSLVSSSQQHDPLFSREGRRQRTVCTYTVKMCIFHSSKSNFVSCEDRWSAIRNAAASFTSFLLDSLRNCPNFLSGVFPLMDSFGHMEDNVTVPPPP